MPKLAAHRSPSLAAARFFQMLLGVAAFVCQRTKMWRSFCAVRAGGCTICAFWTIWGQHQAWIANSTILVDDITIVSLCLRIPGLA